LLVFIVDNFFASTFDLPTKKIGDLDIDLHIYQMCFLSSPHAGAGFLEKAKSSPLYAFLLKEAGLGESWLPFW